MSQADGADSDKTEVEKEKQEVEDVDKKELGGELV